MGAQATRTPPLSVCISRSRRHTCSAITSRRLLRPSGPDQNRRWTDPATHTDWPGAGSASMQLGGRVPQHHRHHVHSAARFLAADGDQIAGEASALFELADLRRRRQAAAEDDEVEIHGHPSRGRRDREKVCGGQ